MGAVSGVGDRCRTKATEPLTSQHLCCCNSLAPDMSRTSSGGHCATYLLQALTATHLLRGALEGYAVSVVGCGRSIPLPLRCGVSTQRRGVPRRHGDDRRTSGLDQGGPRPRPRPRPRRPRVAVSGGAKRHPPTHPMAAASVPPPVCSGPLLTAYTPPKQSAYPRQPTHRQL
mgnify:CR=1 FL=1